MSDREALDFRVWREATDRVAPPAGMVDGVMRAIERPNLADALWSFARPALVAGALVALALVGTAAVAVQGFLHDAADYAMSRGL